MKIADFGIRDWDPGMSLKNSGWSFENLGFGIAIKSESFPDRDPECQPLFISNQRALKYMCELKVLAFYVKWTNSLCYNL